MGMAIKVGFVGAGGRARGHMKTLAEIEDIEFGAICDVVEATACLLYTSDAADE